MCVCVCVLLYGVRCLGEAERVARRSVSFSSRNFLFLRHGEHPFLTLLASPIPFFSRSSFFPRATFPWSLSLSARPIRGRHGLRDAPGIGKIKEIVPISLPWSIIAAISRLATGRKNRFLTRLLLIDIKAREGRGVAPRLALCVHWWSKVFRIWYIFDTSFDISTDLFVCCRCIVMYNQRIFIQELTISSRITDVGCRERSFRKATSEIVH